MTTAREFAEFNRAIERLDWTSPDAIRESFAAVAAASGVWMRRLAASSAVAGVDVGAVEEVIEAASALLAGAVRDEGLTGYADGLLVAEPCP